jgi:hypothetical protein
VIQTITLTDDDKARWQQWLDTIDWTYSNDTTRRRQCPCGRWFNAQGLRKTCRPCVDTCPHDGDHLTGHIVAVNGAQQPHKLCLTCGHLVSLRKGAGPGDFRFRDNRRLYEVHPCARCGSEDGSELHHWAPSAVFGFWEADRWPKSYLCTTCHTLWHREMRRAGGYRLSPEQRIDDITGIFRLFPEQDTA